MSRISNLGHRLYAGEVSLDFIGRRRTWYVMSAVIVLVAVGALAIRGLNLGIEFRGGADFSIPNATCSIEQARSVAESTSGEQAIVTSTSSGTIRVQTETLTPAESVTLAGQLATACGVSVDDIKIQVVGPTWGSEISKKALQGLVVFILLVALFLSISGAAFSGRSHLHWLFRYTGPQAILPLHRASPDNFTKAALEAL